MSLPIKDITAPNLQKVVLHFESVGQLFDALTAERNAFFNGELKMRAHLKQENALLVE
ncbi:hypothetical protein QTN47_08240 [Danxiaibacter flavus]|uniref:Uncharacterized protein n=1 Tax=Danxiaibacter flavus TaxID=3049108 RepID=A0ABV3ZD89_9BACT|nr:hypothetical protein QNM32_08240 [Chitinophagaceae bacterium DXS]